MKILMFLLLSSLAMAEPTMRLLPQEDRARHPSDVEVEVWPTGLIDADRTHYLTANLPTIMIFAIANPQARPVEKAWLVVDVPPGIEIAATNAYLPWHLATWEDCTHDGIAYRRLIVPCQTHETTFPRGRGRGVWFSRYRPPAIWLRTTLADGAETGDVYYQLRYAEAADEIMESPLRSLSLAIMPPIHAVQPALATSGVMGRFILNGSADVARLLAEYFNALGYTYYLGHLTLPPDCGLAHWSESPINNGYSLRLAEPIPADIQYQAEGMDVAHSLAPWALAKPAPWVEKVFLILQERLRNARATGLWANWEPYRYMNHPDTSAGTTAMMDAWEGKPDDPLRKKRFHNWLLGQGARRLAEAAGQAGAGLALAMSNDSMWATIEEHGCSALEWGDFDYLLQTWNYYDVPKAQGPWPVSDRLGAAQVVRAGALTDWFDQQFGNERRMRLGCLYGWDQTGGDGYYLPMQLGFLHLSTIFAGMDNTQNYAEFPVWDGRYAQAIANANTRIARWETMILRGERKRTHVLHPQLPYPRQIPEDAGPDHQTKGGWEQPGYLWSYEYHLDNRRLITVANTWNDGPAVCRLRFVGLEPGHYCLTEPEADHDFGTLTADQLTRGVTVRIDPMSWGAFLLSPITPDQQPIGGTAP